MKDIDGYVTKDNLYRLISRIKGNSDFIVDAETCIIIIKAISDMSKADVQPIRRGRWIKQEGFWNKNTVKCSLCGNYLDMNGVNGGRGDANFCPNCGARMDGEKND